MKSLFVASVGAFCAGFAVALVIVPVSFRSEGKSAQNNSPAAVLEVEAGGLGDAVLHSQTKRSDSFEVIEGIVADSKELVAMWVAGSDPIARNSAVENWLDRIWTADAQAHFDQLLGIFNEAGVRLDEVSQTMLARLTLRVAARRGADLKDMLKFARTHRLEKSDDVALAFAMQPKSFVEALEHGIIRGDEFGVLAFGAKLSPEKLRALIERREIPNRGELLSAYFKASGTITPLWAADFAQTFPAAELPTDLIDRVAAKLLTYSEGNPAEWLSSLPRGERDAVLDRGFRHLNSRKGFTETAGREWLQSAALNYVRLRSASGDFPAVDARAAFEYLGALDADVLNRLYDALPESSREEVTRGAYEVKLADTAKRGLDQVEALLASVPERIKGHLADKAAAALAQYDWRVALTYIAGIPDPAQRRRAWISTLESPGLSIPISDRLGAIQSLMASGESGPEIIEVINRQFQPRVNFTGAFDPADHIDKLKSFLESLPSSIQEDVVAPFVSTWATYLPVAASEWIAALPPGSVRDRAAHQLVVLSQDDPEIALTNTAAIANVKLRRDAVRQLAETWAAVDKEFFNTVLDQSPLSAAEKEFARHQLNGS